jgi:hypothetical protein
MVNRGTIHSLRWAKMGDILEPMQEYLACQIKPALFRPDQSQFPGVTAVMAAFPEGGGTIIFILLYRENPVKYTDPDGRENEYLNDLVYRPWKDKIEITTADFKYYRDYNDITYSNLNGSQEINIPLLPPNIDTDANIAQAKRMKLIGYLIPGIGLLIKYICFYSKVKSGGLWDYKQQGISLEYENFGNFHYGLIGRAAGIPKSILRRAAGWAQKKDRTWKPEYGN